MACSRVVLVFCVLFLAAVSEGLKALWGIPLVNDDRQQMGLDLMAQEAPSVLWSCVL